MWNGDGDDDDRRASYQKGKVYTYIVNTPKLLSSRAAWISDVWFCWVIIIMRTIEWGWQIATMFSLMFIRLLSSLTCLDFRWWLRYAHLMPGRSWWWWCSHLDRMMTVLVLPQSSGKHIPAELVLVESYLWSYLAFYNVFNFRPTFKTKESKMKIKGCGWGEKKKKDAKYIQTTQSMICNACTNWNTLMEWKSVITEPAWF